MGAEDRERTAPPRRNRFKGAVRRLLHFVIAAASWSKVVLARTTQDTPLGSETTGPVRQHQRRHKPQPKSPCSFANSTDNLSDARIVQELVRLNERAEQGAFSMVDALVERLELPKNMTQNLTEEQATAARRVSRYIDPVLSKSVALKASEGIHTLLQIAFQGCLTHALCAVSSGAFELGRNVAVARVDQGLFRTGE